MSTLTSKLRKITITQINGGTFNWDRKLTNKLMCSKSVNFKSVDNGNQLPALRTAVYTRKYENELETWENKRFQRKTLTATWIDPNFTVLSDVLSHLHQAMQIWRRTAAGFHFFITLNRFQWINITLTAFVNKKPKLRWCSGGWIQP